MFDLDVTAEIRPGYFGLPDIGTLFVENRYAKHCSWWPHQTLRNLWSLAEVVDPVRLRMEFSLIRGSMPTDTPSVSLAARSDLNCGAGTPCSRR